MSPVFISTANFRFREMSDFQYTTINSSFAQKARSSILRGDYEKIKQFDVESAREILSDDIDAMPPPVFSQVVYPYNYAYRQNPAIAVIDDGTGGSKLVNTTAAQKLESVLAGWNDKVPTEPSSNLETPMGPLKECVEALNTLFESRPCWTRAALDSLLNEENRRLIRKALPYVSYAIKSGPWRGAYIKYGIDPKSSVDFAKYQVEHYRVLTKAEVRSMREEWEKSRIQEPESSGGQKNHQNEINDEAKQIKNGIEVRPGDVPDRSAELDVNGQTSNSSHKIYTFDGKQLPLSMMIQLVDVTDPQLTGLIASARLKEDCDREFGWYNSEDISVLRRVLRIKLVACKNKETISDEAFAGIINEQRKIVTGGDRDRRAETGHEEESNGQGDGSGEAERSIMITESEVLSRLGGQVEGGSERLKDLFGYVQQGADNEYDGYSLMEDDDDEDEEDEEDEDDDDDDGEDDDELEPGNVGV
ncbi:transcription factor TFIIIC subunit TFC1 [Sugiyamaella lignohabitans]|uniref:Transcription factor TFIIIC subunit TFC1 n=1 Tax=Sugiyamaella lignohabitans TaxID=796027 RepID=A0A167D7F0_9ASCO|nr:transcription factor TFIIIC subunit TFC1 [Sugiyamaella lignohabitans]ANB12573.1 transcription factor TFIIIC subunit TFC1 [Sugiyamaella lignohabitans]